MTKVYRGIHTIKNTKAEKVQSQSGIYRGTQARS